MSDRPELRYRDGPSTEASIDTAAPPARVWALISDLQLPAAFHEGKYASANLLWAPVTNVMMGGELQWIHRENFSDGFDVSDRRLQFSFKYSFSAKVTGE